MSPSRPPVRDREQAFGLDDGWQHVGCPTCGHVDTFPTGRLESEGAPWCPHNHSSIAFNTGRHRETWTQMVPVRIVDALLPQPDPEVERGTEFQEGMRVMDHPYRIAAQNAEQRAERAEADLRTVREAAQALLAFDWWAPEGGSRYLALDALRTVLSSHEDG